MKKTKWILAIALGLGVAVTGIVFKDKIKSAIIPKPETPRPVEIIDLPEPTIDIEYVKSKLENISELRTAKITYGCTASFKQGSIPLLTKKAFEMYYEVKAYAGINVSEITCLKDKDDIFIIQLPKAELYEPVIDPESLEFFDDAKALFNTQKKEDVKIALQEAKKDVYHQAATINLLDIADENAVSIISSLLSGFLEKDSFKIVKGDRSGDKYVHPPVSSKEDFGTDYKGLQKRFQKAGFKNVKLEKVKSGYFSKEGEILSIEIGEVKSFKKSSYFKPDNKVIISYSVKK